MNPAPCGAGFGAFAVFAAFLFVGTPSGLFAQNTDEANAAEALNVRKSFFSFFSANLGISGLFFPVDPSDLGYDVSPILPSPHLGLGFPFLFSGTTTISVELSYDGYLNNYMVPKNPSPQRPYPAAAENRGAFVFGNILGVHFQGKTELSTFVSFRYSAGAAFDLRYITTAFDLGEKDIEGAGSEAEFIKEYFWSKSRFIFPTLGFGIDFKLWPGISAGIEGRVWLPVYIWVNGEESSYALEGWRFGAAFRVTFLNEPSDSKVRAGLEQIKALYKTTRNDYAFILYHLENNSPGKGGVSTFDLSAEIAKTYRHSRVFAADRKSINNTTIVNMFAEISENLNKYTYDPMSDLIRRK